MAYGPLELRPHELLALTPTEFAQLFEGWRWREDQRKQTLAYMLTYLVNPHVKKSIKFETFYEQLLGPDEVKQRRLKDHRAIIRDRRRKQSEGRTMGKRRRG